MGNTPSGVSARILREIKEGDVYPQLIAKSETNLFIDLDPSIRVPDPFEQRFEIKWEKKLKSHFVVLFPHYAENDKKVLYTSKYSYSGLQTELNDRLRDMPLVNGEEFGLDGVNYDRMAFCWGDNTYVIKGIPKDAYVYIIWASQVKSVNQQSKKTTLYVKKGAIGVPVIVVTNGYYRPIVIFPIHPGEMVDGIRRPPRVIDPNKTTCNWKDHDLLVLDSRKPPKEVPKIKLRSELEVDTTVNELEIVGFEGNSEILEEEDPFFDGLGSDSTSDDEAVDLGIIGGHPPIEIVNGQDLASKLTIETVGNNFPSFIQRTQSVKKVGSRRKKKATSVDVTSSREPQGKSQITLSNLINIFGQKK